MKCTVLESSEVHGTMTMTTVLKLYTAARPRVKGRIARTACAIEVRHRQIHHARMAPELGRREGQRGRQQPDLGTQRVDAGPVVDAWTPDGGKNSQA